MLYDSRHGIIWRAFVWVSWCLLGMACSDHALPIEQPAEEAPRAASLPKQPAQQTAPASADWTAEVQQRMANGARAIRADGANAFRVTNRKQGLTAKVDSSGGLQIEPRTGGASSVHLQLASMGREGMPRPLGGTSLGLGACASDGAVDEMGACLKRLEVKRDGVVEWWESRENGLEQGFVIENRPMGKGLLELRVAVEGAQVEVSGDHASEVTLQVDERTAWEYAGLSVMDAGGKALDSWMERDDAGGIRIVVDDEEAAYPVVIDPVLSATPDWTAESNQESAQFGNSLASAGDINGDGYGDVIVGVPLYDAEMGSLTDAGRVYLYLGNATGVQPEAVWTMESTQAFANFGASVASAGDVNGDGFGDVIVGAPHSDSGLLSNAGRAYIYLGGPTGLGDTFAWTADSGQANADFGYSVASAGDVNGDGFSDVIVGAPYYDGGQTDEGRAFVYLGSAMGPEIMANWTTESDQTNALYGSFVANAGDVNGDGFSDVIVGSPKYDNGQTDEGRAYVYLGSASGLGITAAWTAEVNQANAEFGTSVSSVGDVNGDGYGDVIVGASLYDNGQTDEGRVYVYSGSALGLESTAAWTAESNQIDAYFGISVASAGDVNGDGFGDVIVGASHYDNGQTNEGRAYVYLGSASGLAGMAAWTREANQNHAFFGVSVASAGDTNGDGYSDVIIGAPYYDSGENNEGRGYVYLGSASSLGVASAWMAESNQPGARFGWSVASAGDVNGDGFGDVIVGVPFYDDVQTNEGGVYVFHGRATGLETTVAWKAESNQAGAQFGWSAASAGDVNGDGFGDVIVGAPFYDQNKTDEGGAFVYLGGASGLEVSPAWTANSDQNGAFFGFSVASAGDVNGDGFGDVIVGAVIYDNPLVDGGQAYVYLGSPNGLLDPTMNPPWTAKSNKASSNFGNSVASAGDVNGDGFGDVIIGAPTYDDAMDRVDTGRAYVYLGSANGLLDPSTTPPWTAEADQEFAIFGWSVASAGDVNGDGYSDIIVGARGYDNGQLYSDAGRAYVYLGGASGLAQSAAWIAEPAQEEAYFGTSVSSAGDVNGDGFGDVVVGAPGYGNGQVNEGHVHVYLGSASGLSTVPEFTATSDKANVSFGWSAASAGDVNGDGCSEVIVGAYLYEGGEPAEGRTLLYTSFSGSRPYLRLSNPVTNRPLAPWNALGGPVVRVTALGASPFGQVNVRAEVEAKPLGVAFDGQGTTISPSWMPAFASGTAEELVTEVSLVQAKPHHLRWRLRYRPSDARPAIVSRWVYAPSSGDAQGVHFRFGVCGNGLLEGDEACDDDNVASGDGCNVACQFETGSICATAGACATGFCVDGVCCDSACTGTCRACTAQLKGSGVDGECGDFAEGTDPEDDCTLDPESTCQFDGLCDGNGACRLWADGTTCSADTCSGNASKQSFCDGLGTCLLDLLGTDCGSNGCDPATGQCIGTCTADTDCVADAYCDSVTSQCKPKATLGTTCTASSQCQSGHCTDNVCCKEACDGTCQVCGADGLCGNVAASTPDDGCAADPMNPCGNIGSCADAGMCAQAASGTVCSEPSCSSGMAQTSSCDGHGMCMPMTTSCGDYACGATSCNTQCTTNQDCSSSAYCDNGQCKPDTSLGNVCTSDAECLLGHCIDTGMGSKVCCQSDCASDACLPNRCTAAGECISSTLDCTPYQCANATSCKTSCSSDADCLSGYECRNNECGVTTCDSTKKCLEGETCNANTHTCVAVNEAASGCSCQLPGLDSKKTWSFASLAFALLLLRRNRSRAASSMRAS